MCFFPRRRNAGQPQIVGGGKGERVAKTPIRVFPPSPRVPMQPDGCWRSLPVIAAIEGVRRFRHPLIRKRSAACSAVCGIHKKKSDKSNGSCIGVTGSLPAPVLRVTVMFQILNFCLRNVFCSFQHFFFFCYF